MLHEAARTNDVEKCRRALNAGLNPEAPDRSGWTPLHVAAQEGHLDIARALIEVGTNPELSNRARASLSAARAQLLLPASGDTALHCAAGAGHLDVARFLIGCGADPLRKNNTGRTPLEKATSQPMRDLLRYAHKRPLINAESGPSRGSTGGASGSGAGADDAQRNFSAELARLASIASGPGGPRGSNGQLDRMEQAFSNLSALLEGSGGAGGAGGAGGRGGAPAPLSPAGDATPVPVASPGGPAAERRQVERRSERFFPATGGAGPAAAAPAPPPPSVPKELMKEWLSGAKDPGDFIRGIGTQQPAAPRAAASAGAAPTATATATAAAPAPAKRWSGNEELLQARQQRFGGGAAAAQQQQQPQPHHSVSSPHIGAGAGASQAPASAAAQSRPGSAAPSVPSAASATAALRGARPQPAAAAKPAAGAAVPDSVADALNRLAMELGDSDTSGLKAQLASVAARSVQAAPASPHAPTRPASAAAASARPAPAPAAAASVASRQSKAEEDLAAALRAEALAAERAARGLASDGAFWFELQPGEVVGSAQKAVKDAAYAARTTLAPAGKAIATATQAAQAAAQAAVQAAVQGPSAAKALAALKGILPEGVVPKPPAPPKPPPPTPAWVKTAPPVPTAQTVVPPPGVASAAAGGAAGEEAVANAYGVAHVSDVIPDVLIDDIAAEIAAFTAKQRTEQADLPVRPSENGSDADTPTSASGASPFAPSSSSSAPPPAPNGGAAGGGGGGGAAAPPGPDLDPLTREEIMKRRVRELEEQRRRAAKGGGGAGDKQKHAEADLRRMREGQQDQQRRNMENVLGEEDLANLRNATAAETVFTKRTRDDPSIQDPFLWPKANAPQLVEAGLDSLHVSWTVPSHDDTTVFTSQLQLIPPGEADWVTVMDRLVTWRFEVKNLLPGTSYVLRVRVMGTTGMWGPYSAPSMFSTTGTAPPGSRSGGMPRPHSAAAAGGFGAGVGAGYGAGAGGFHGVHGSHSVPTSLDVNQSPEEALASAMTDVRRQISVLRTLPSASDRRTRLRQLKMKYHPDKAQAEQRALFEELSKFINSETNGMS